MPETTIVRTENIVVATVSSNSYNDLLFTDKAGKEYKVGKNRRQYFEKIIVPDTGVQLNYATAYGREYIYKAVQIKDNLPPPVTPKLPEQAKKIVDAAKPTETPPAVPQAEPPVDKVETAMFYKEIGELYRGGFLNDENPVEKKMKHKYFNRLFKAVGIDVQYKD